MGDDITCHPFFLIFKYYPMYGAQIAFRDYNPVDGIVNSEWVGFEHFERFFNSDQFWTLLGNTLTISFYQLLAGFPLPVIFALMVSHLNSLRFKKLVQTITYAPHFISVVVLVGMMFIIFSPSGGVIPLLYEKITGADAPLYMGEPAWFPHLYVWSGVWQEMGWNAIVYIAALG